MRLNNKNDDKKKRAMLQFKLKRFKARILKKYKTFFLI